MQVFLNPATNQVWTIAERNKEVRTTLFGADPETAQDASRKFLRLRSATRHLDELIEQKLSDGFSRAAGLAEALQAAGLAPTTSAAPPQPTPVAAKPTPTWSNDVPLIDVERFHEPPGADVPEVKPVTVLTARASLLDGRFAERSMGRVLPRRDRPSRDRPFPTAAPGQIAIVVSEHEVEMRQLLSELPLHDNDRELLRLPIGTVDSPVHESGRAFLLGKFLPPRSPQAHPVGNEIADLWVEQAGLPFAVMAAEESHGWPDAGGSSNGNYMLWSRVREPQPFWLYRHETIGAVLARLRHHIAAATHADYAKALATGTALRSGAISTRCRMSFLFPEQASWVDADLAELTPLLAAALETDRAGAGDSRFFIRTMSRPWIWLLELLLYATSSATQLEAMVVALNRQPFFDRPNLLATLLDGIGDPLAPWLTAWASGNVLPSQPRRKGYESKDEHPAIEALAGIETDEATAELVSLHDRRHVPARLEQVAKARPAQFVRAAAIEHLRKSAPELRRLLTVALRSDPSASAVSDLDAEALELVHGIEARVNAPEAPASLVPPSLAEPRWGEIGASKTPRLPKFLVLDSITPPLLLDGVHQISADAAKNLVRLLSLNKVDNPLDAVGDAIAALEPESRAEFGWELFLAWQAAKTPSKHAWLMQALGFLGNDETVDRLVPLILAWPSNSAVKRATSALWVLANIGSPHALIELYRISTKAKSKPLKRDAGKHVQSIAERLALTSEQLADRLIPDLGLDPLGAMTLDYGHRSFTVTFNEQLVPLVRDDAGKIRKTLPKPGVKDDEELAPASYKQFSALKREAKAMASDQLQRLERAMTSGRSIPADEFMRFFVRHPFVVHLVRRLVFTAEIGADRNPTFRVTEDSTLADAKDEPFALPEGATVRVMHPLTENPAEVAAWGEMLSDYELLQPFDQVGRSTHEMSEAELDSTRFTRFAGQTIAGSKFLSLGSRGWDRGDSEEAGVILEMLYRLSDGRLLHLEMEHGLFSFDLGGSPDGGILGVWIGDSQTRWHKPGHDITFRSLRPVERSELIRDLEMIFEHA